MNYTFKVLLLEVLFKLLFMHLIFKNLKSILMYFFLITFFFSQMQMTNQ